MTPSKFIKHHFTNVCCNKNNVALVEGVEWSSLFLPLRKYRLESLLFPLNIPELKELEDIYKQAYDIQIHYLQSIAETLREVPGFTLIQGFAWNDSFASNLPLSIRGDIDALLPQGSTQELHERLKISGFEKRVFIDNALTTISEQLSKSISNDMKWDYPKNLAFSKLLNIPDMKPKYFEFGSIFGPLVKSNDKWFLLFMIEETYSFGYKNDTNFFISQELTEPFRGLRRSNLFGLLLTAAIRVSISLKAKRLRLRTVLETAIHLEALTRNNSANLISLIDISRRLEIQKELLDLIKIIDYLAEGNSQARASILNTNNSNDALDPQSVMFINECLTSLDQQFLNS